VILKNKGLNFDGLLRIVGEERECGMSQMELQLVVASPLPPPSSIATWAAMAADELRLEKFKIASDS